jgi:hypothetical protein
MPSDSVCAPHLYCSNLLLVIVVTLLFTSLQLSGRAATMVAIRRSPVSRASTRLVRLGDKGGVCLAGGGSLGSMGMGAAILFVTLCVSREFKIVEVITIVA